MLTNDVVSFEQLGPEVFTLKFFHVIDKALSGELFCTWTGLVIIQKNKKSL